MALAQGAATAAIEDETDRLSPPQDVGAGGVRAVGGRSGEAERSGGRPMPAGRRRSRRAVAAAFGRSGRGAEGAAVVCGWRRSRRGVAAALRRVRGRTRGGGCCERGRPRRVVAAAFGRSGRGARGAAVVCGWRRSRRGVAAALRRVRGRTRGGGCCERGRLRRVVAATLRRRALADRRVPSSTPIEDHLPDRRRSRMCRQTKIDPADRRIPRRSGQSGQWANRGSGPIAAFVR
jgi:hypothetical protein